MPRRRVSEAPLVVTSVRLPGSSAARLQAAADEAGASSLSEHLRDRLLVSLAELAPVRPGEAVAATSTADRLALTRAAGQLGRVGSNLNQAVRVLHEARLGGVPIGADLLARLATEVEAIAQARLELTRAAVPYARRASLVLPPGPRL